MSKLIQWLGGSLVALSLVAFVGCAKEPGIKAPKVDDHDHDHDGDGKPDHEHDDHDHPHDKDGGKQPEGPPIEPSINPKAGEAPAPVVPPIPPAGETK